MRHVVFIIRSDGGAGYVIIEVIKKKKMRLYVNMLLKQFRLIQHDLQEVEYP